MIEELNLREEQANAVGISDWVELRKIGSAQSSIFPN